MKQIINQFINFLKPKNYEYSTKQNSENVYHLLILLSFSSCEVVEGIFNFGVGVGVFIVIAVLAIIIWIISRFRK